MIDKKIQLQELIKESVQSSLEWNKASYLINGLIEVFNLTKEEVYLEKVNDWAKEALAKEQCNEEIMIGANNLLKLYELTKDTHYKEQIESLHEQILKKVSQEESNLTYEAMHGIYPFYMAYETKFNKMNGYMDIYRQFLSKAAKEDKSRQDLVWFAMTLIDTLEDMDEQIFYEYRKLMSLFKESITTLLEGDSDCEFEQIAMSYLVIKGVRLNYLPERLLGKGVELFEALNSSEVEDIRCKGLMVLTYAQLLKVEKEN